MKMFFNNISKILLILSSGFTFANYGCRSLIFIVVPKTTVNGEMLRLGEGGQKYFFLYYI